MAEGQHGAPGTKAGPKLARGQVWGNGDDSRSPQKSERIYFPARHLSRHTDQPHSVSAPGTQQLSCRADTPSGDGRYQPSGTVGTQQDAVCRGMQGCLGGSRASHSHLAWPKSHSPGLGLNLLLSMQALWVWELGHTLPDGNLRATPIQVVQIGPGLLRNLPIVSPCGTGEARLHRGHTVHQSSGETSSR